MIPSDDTPVGPVNTPAPDPEAIKRQIERAKSLIQPSTPGPAGDEPASRRLRVLCVDDHKDAADGLVAVLELLGCDARACYDGPSALAAVAEFRPDACLLDLNMPRMDGLELAAHIRAGAGSRPLLLVATTALDWPEDLAKTAIAGFHFHLVKPVSSSDIRAALDPFRAVLARRGVKISDAETPPDDSARGSSG